MFREILPHFFQAFFVKPMLLPFLIIRIEHERQRNPGEKSPHDDAPFASLSLNVTLVFEMRLRRAISPSPSADRPGARETLADPWLAGAYVDRAHQAWRRDRSFSRLLLWLVLARELRGPV
jgi:hypothetical protein